jgi:hypothetical protein
MTIHVYAACVGERLRRWVVDKQCKITITAGPINDVNKIYALFSIFDFDGRYRPTIARTGELGKLLLEFPALWSKSTAGVKVGVELQFDEDEILSNVCHNMITALYNINTPDLGQWIVDYGLLPVLASVFVVEEGILSAVKGSYPNQYTNGTLVTARKFGFFIDADVDGPPLQYRVLKAFVPLLPVLLAPAAFYMIDTAIWGGSLLYDPSDVDLSLEVIRNTFVHLDKNDAEFKGYEQDFLTKLPDKLNAYLREATLTFPGTLGNAGKTYTDTETKLVGLSYVFTAVPWLKIPIKIRAASQAWDSEKTRYTSIDITNQEKVIKAIEKEYERLTVGDPDTIDTVNNQRRARLLHQPEPRYMMQPRFTGVLRLRPEVTAVLHRAMNEIRKYAPGLRTASLDQIERSPTESGLKKALSEFAAALNAKTRLFWPTQYKKDMEFKGEMANRQNAMTNLRCYRMDPDGTVTIFPTPIEDYSTSYGPRVFQGGGGGGGGGGLNPVFRI